MYHPQGWTSEPKDALISSTAREGMYVEKFREPEDEASNVYYTDTVKRWLEQLIYI